MEKIFIDLAIESGTSFQLGDLTLSALSALRSPEVTSDLLSIGTISLNIAAPGVFDVIDMADGTSVMATVFDYALEVAPRSDGSKKIIDVGVLSRHAALMRAEFGDVEISAELIKSIGQHAQMQINFNDLEPQDHLENI